ncbi:MAG: hypothetical protein QOE44_1625 [Solirubrobacteraceae bacterium]|nr:hypothetical protein [Solirubrobacteraceae bacterium]
MRSGAGGGGGWRAWTLGSLWLALAARVLAGPLPLNYYDIGYALVWGREILAGHLPDYRTPGASTPHPLGTLLGTLGAAFGAPGGWYVVQVIVFVSVGVAGTALFMLARTCLRPAVDPGNRPSRRATLGGGVAVGVLLLSPPFLTDAVGGSGLSDLPALALVLTAAALVAADSDSERTRTPLVLLAAAGLMRPEAWGLAGAYWVYLAYRRLPARRLIESAVLVLSAPVVWVLSDAIVVGDATYSLTHTQAASQTGAFAHGLAQVPRATLDGVRALVGLPVLVVGAIGALTAVGIARRATVPALALLALALGEFAALGLADVPLIGRFLLVVAAMTCLFFAYAVLAAGNQALARLGLERRGPRTAVTIAAALLVVVVAVSHIAGDARVRPQQRAAVHAEAVLVSLARRPRVGAVIGDCPGFSVPRYTLTSLVAYDFDLAPTAIRRTGTAPPAPGLILVPATAGAGRYFGVTPARLADLRRMTASGHQVARNRSWRLYVSGCPPG